MDNTAAFYNNSSRYFLYHDNLLPRQFYGENILALDRALSNSNVCRNRKQSKTRGFSVKDCPPIIFLTYYQEYRQKYFLLKGGAECFSGILGIYPLFLSVFGFENLKYSGINARRKHQPDTFQGVGSNSL